MFGNLKATEMGMIGKIIGLAVVAMLLHVILAGPAFADAVSPLEQLRGSVDSILKVMKDKELSHPDRSEERRGLIMDVVDKRFDFVEISRMTLGRSWKERSAEEKKEFVELFAELLKNTYIGRIESYSDEEVEYTKQVFSQNGPDRARVYTNILKEGHEIPINYSLMKKGDEWFVYDVIIEGVSLVRNYRTEFRRILGKEDFAGLVKRMREKIANNEAQRDK